MALVVGIVVTVTALPFGIGRVQAHTDACAGQGNFKLEAGLTHAVIGPPVSTTFYMDIVIGTCESFSQLLVDGNINGTCSTTTGTGTTRTGHDFAFTGVGGVLVLTGQMVGVLAIAPKVGQSCVAHTGADEFQVDGTVALTH